jgi:hypothetical protein
MPADVHFTVMTPAHGGQSAETKSYSVLSDDISVVQLQRGETARLAIDNSTYTIEPDAAYYFGSLPSGKIDFVRIGLADMPPADLGPASSANAIPHPPENDEAARTITVKIFVDDDEPGTRGVWEHRIRERIAAVSDILERTCGMKLKIVGSGTWHINTSIPDFDTAVNDFISSVSPGEARLAIGFTGRYQNPSGRMHMGGTKGPLAHHILVREWSRHFTEQERVEFLLHEVGHFLGAVHSPESDAVMRSMLGDRQSRSKRFQIHFDPLNALAMNLVAEEIRTRHINSFSDLSPPTKARLRAIYQEIQKALPSDPAAGQYLQYLGAVTPRAVPLGLQ